jgi:hypothetical protein
MDPVTLAGLFSAGGSILGSGISARSTAKQMSFQSKANQKQMDFQERMSNTSHQREITDLRKAGLNPILSAGGNGASSPSGATSSGASFQGDTSIGDKVNSASVARRHQIQMLKNMEQTRTKDAVTTHLIASQDRNERAKLPNIEKTGRLIDAQTNSALGAGAEGKATEDLYKTLESVGGDSGAARLLKQLLMRLIK